MLHAVAVGPPAGTERATNSSQAPNSIEQLAMSVEQLQVNQKIWIEMLVIENFAVSSQLQQRFRTVLDSSFGEQGRSTQVLSREFNNNGPVEVMLQCRCVEYHCA